MDFDEKACLCAFHSIDGIGHKTLFKIKDYFGSFATGLKADYKELNKEFLSTNLWNEVNNIKDNYIEYMNNLINDGIQVITIDETEYPAMLKNISNPPFLLYCRGDVNLLNEFCIAVVGARAATTYGKTVAFNMGKQLAKQGIITVSGMARGVDTQAHKGVLEEQGKTIAVLGSGINIIYPKENTNLYNQICESGLIVSEFSPSCPPNPNNFPMRNRIISGLSYGVLVVEAKIKSGALITADFALEQGKDVFAIPGQINSKTSEGCNNLIKQGAKLVDCIEDILEEYYDIKSLVCENIVQEELVLIDDNERLILNNMEFEPCHFDKLLDTTSLRIGDLSMALLNLELKGIVKSMPGNYYIKVTDIKD